MPNPANARIAGKNVSQLERLNVRQEMYREGSPVRSEADIGVQYVSEAADLSGDLDGSVIYFITTSIDMGDQSITVPAGGLNIRGHTFDISKLTTYEDSHTLFVSPSGGSGNLLMTGLAIEVTGTSSQVYDLTAATGSEAVEIADLNYNDCTSLGELTDFRQGLETNTGRFGGTPELTFSGAWDGFRATTAIVRNIDNISALFKTGAGLSFSGRFITDINCDLPANGALIDFSPSEFDSNEGLVLNKCFVTRDGDIDSSDTTIYPNIDNTSVKSNWDDNIGVPNTKKYSKGVCTAEVTTTVSATSTFYPLAGAITIETSSHFDEPSNGQYRLLTGNGAYTMSGDLTLDSNANDQIVVRVTKSTDGGSTFPSEINRVLRTINNLSGPRDVAFVPLNFIATLKAGDRIRIEVSNETGTNNITQELDSYFIVTEI